MMNELPTISVVIPVYNAEKFLGTCLQSVREQDYPADKIEIIIIDGGSTDTTLEIARKFKVNKTLSNPLKTGETGRAVGVRVANNEIIALIDSDNILPQRDWFQRMIEPFKDPEIIGSEPLYYTHRKEDGYITRYCALLGMNDPLCLFIGNYDRYCALTGKWTQMPVQVEDIGNYLKVKLDERKLPTIGANGFLVRRSQLKYCGIGDYFFDLDVAYELIIRGYNRFAKVKIGIIHIFSESILMFIKKQQRRIRDYGYYENVRKYPWLMLLKGRLFNFIVYTILVFPLAVQALKGWVKKRDSAWAFHIPACLTTLIIYSCGTLKNMIRAEEKGRSRWNAK